MNQSIARLATPPPLSFFFLRNPPTPIPPSHLTFASFLLLTYIMYHYQGTKDGLIPPSQWDPKALHTAATKINQKKSNITQENHMQCSVLSQYLIINGICI